MRVQRLRRQGNSACITLNAPQLRQMGITSGEYIATEVVGDLFVVVKLDKYKESLTQPAILKAIQLLTKGTLE